MRAHLPEAQRPPKAELNETFIEAQRALEDGIGRLRKPVDAGGQVSPLLAAAVLSLGQICLEAGQAQQAIAWFDDPKIGPHTLVKAKHPLDRPRHLPRGDAQGYLAGLRGRAEAGELRSDDGRPGEDRERSESDADLLSVSAANWKNRSSRPAARTTRKKWPNWCAASPRC